MKPSETHPCHCVPWVTVGLRIQAVSVPNPHPLHHFTASQEDFCQKAALSLMREVAKEGGQFPDVRRLSAPGTVLAGITPEGLGNRAEN